MIVLVSIGWYCRVVVLMVLVCLILWFILLVVCCCSFLIWCRRIRYRFVIIIVSGSWFMCWVVSVFILIWVLVCLVILLCVVWVSCLNDLWSSKCFWYWVLNRFILMCLRWCWCSMFRVMVRMIVCYGLVLVCWMLKVMGWRLVWLICCVLLMLICIWSVWIGFGCRCLMLFIVVIIRLVIWFRVWVGKFMIGWFFWSVCRLVIWCWWCCNCIGLLGCLCYRCWRVSVCWIRLVLLMVLVFMWCLFWVVIWDWWFWLIVIILMLSGWRLFMLFLVVWSSRVRCCWSVEVCLWGWWSVVVWDVGFGYDVVMSVFLFFC